MKTARQMSDFRHVLREGDKMETSWNSAGNVNCLPSRQLRCIIILCREKRGISCQDSK